MKKRIIACITVLALCFSVLGIPASAATATVTKEVDGATKTFTCNLYRTSSNATASMSVAGSTRVSLDGYCEQTPNQGVTFYSRPLKGSGTGSCSDAEGPITSSYIITHAYVKYYAGAANSFLTDLSA